MRVIRPRTTLRLEHEETADTQWRKAKNVIHRKTQHGPSHHFMHFSFRFEIVEQSVNSQNLSR